MECVSDQGLGLTALSGGLGTVFGGRRLEELEELPRFFDQGILELVVVGSRLSLGWRRLFALVFSLNLDGDLCAFHRRTPSEDEEAESSLEWACPPPFFQDRYGAPQTVAVGFPCQSLTCLRTFQAAWAPAWMPATA